MNYDAYDIADCAVNGYIIKTNNLYFNRTYLSRKVNLVNFFGPLLEMVKHEKN